MKRLLSTLLVLAIMLALPLSAQAAVANPPDTNTALDSITVSVPYFPGLKITMTDAPYLVGEGRGTAPHQVKFYFGPNTTVSFNQSVSLGSKQGETLVSVEAGESFKPYDYRSGDAISTFVIASKDGHRVSNDSTINFVAGESSYMLTFANVNVYKGNIAEGYRFTDIRDWEASSSTTAPSTSANPTSTTTVSNPFPSKYSLSGKTATIRTDFDGDGKTDFSYSIPGVIGKADKVVVADAEDIVDREDTALVAIDGWHLNAYTVKGGTKIDLAGAKDVAIGPVELDSDGKLNNFIMPDGASFSDYMKLSGGGRDENGGLVKGTTVAPQEEGLYVFAVIANGVSVNEESAYRYNAIVLRVVK